MAETRRKFDQGFREGAVRLVRETGKPIAQIAPDLGIKAGTQGNRVNADQRRQQAEHGQGHRPFHSDGLGLSRSRLTSREDQVSSARQDEPCRCG
jgi:transposase-like protein